MALTGNEITMGMQHEVKEGICFVRLHGRLDIEEAPAVQQKLLELVAEGMSRMVLDFEHLVYISSSGLRVLISLLKGCRARLGDCRLLNVQPHVLQIFEIGGFEQIFLFFKTEEEAINSFVES